MEVDVKLELKIIEVYIQLLDRGYREIPAGNFDVLEERFLTLFEAAYGEKFVSKSR